VSLEFVMAIIPDKENIDVHKFVFCPRDVIRKIIRNGILCLWGN
jgi:hypothetical protein